MSTKIGRQLAVLVAFGGVLAVGAVALGGGGFSGFSVNSAHEGESKVTFSATVGDGKTWAGGMEVTYSIGGHPNEVTVLALDKSTTSANTWRTTKWVKRGTAVAVAATADYPGVLTVVQLRCDGMSARPVQGLGRQTVVVVHTVP